jgi:hypothetical protein
LVAKRVCRKVIDKDRDPTKGGQHEEEHQAPLNAKLLKHDA